MGVTPKELKAMEANSREITKINNRLKRLQNSVMSRVNKPRQPEESPEATAAVDNGIKEEATQE